MPAGLEGPRVSWVVLTRGDRPGPLDRAIRSIHACSDDPEIVLVANGASLPVVPDGVHLVELEHNVGIPAGRDIGLRATSGDIVCFLDDDAEVVNTDAIARIAQEFTSDARVAVVGFRIVDDAGESARRHVPRVGRVGAGRAGDVVTFLGGACAIDRAAYDAVGGFWSALFYGHEELDLAWRLIDCGYAVRYQPHIEVWHPTAEIGRHADGWWRTGRNRVMIARRNLPWLVAVGHVVFWSIVGFVRAPGRASKRAYVDGLRTGLRSETPRRPIAWSTVRRLAQLGRPPLI